MFSSRLTWILLQTLKFVGKMDILASPTIFLSQPATEFSSIKIDADVEFTMQNDTIHANYEYSDPLIMHFHSFLLGSFYENDKNNSWSNSIVSYDTASWLATFKKNKPLKKTVAQYNNPTWKDKTIPKINVSLNLLYRNLGYWKISAPFICKFQSIDSGILWTNTLKSSTNCDRCVINTYLCNRKSFSFSFWSIWPLTDSMVHYLPLDFWLTGFLDHSFLPLDLWITGLWFSAFPKIW